MKSTPATTETIQSQVVEKIDSRTFQVVETVVKVSPLNVDDINEQIKHHQEMIDKLQGQLSDASAKGVDISIAEVSVAEAIK